MKGAAVTRWRTRLLRASVSTMAIGFAVGTVILLVQLGSDDVTYGARSILFGCLTVAAGVGLTLAGALTWLDGTNGSVGPILMALGVVWLLPIWVGWQTGPGVVVSLAMIAAPITVPTLLHLALTSPDGRPLGRMRSWLVAANYSAAVAVSVARVLLRDPFFDPYCWNDCAVDTFLISSVPAAVHSLDALWLMWSLGLSLTTVLVALRRLRVDSAAALWRRATILVPVATAAAGEVAYRTLLWIDPAESPAKGDFAVLYVVRCADLVLVAVGCLINLTQRRSRRARMARLVRELERSPSPGTLEDALARSVGDPALAVAYWLPEQERFVSASGEPTPVEPTGKRVVSEIHRGGQLIAAIVHDQSLNRSEDLASMIGPAIRLAIDNERLRASLLSQLNELRASQARIVISGDAVRRQLERDLHDGAQQHLLAVGYELQMARAEATADASLTPSLEAASALVRTTLEDLRQFAHGVFPAILDEAGLEPALWTLTEQAKQPVQMHGLPRERLPPSVERAAYLIVKETVEGVATSAQLRIRVTRAIDRLDLEVDVDGSISKAGIGQSDWYLHLADYIGAMGGRLSTRPAGLRAEIPCVS